MKKVLFSKFLPILSLFLFSSPLYAQIPTVDIPGARVGTGIKCAGNKSLVIKNRSLVVVRGPAISVSGSCALRLQNVNISSRGIGIRVSGNGKVFVLKSRITASAAAIAILNRGQLKLRSSVVVGRPAVLVRQNGKFYRAGKNTITGGIRIFRPGTESPKRKSPPPALRPVPSRRTSSPPPAPPGKGYSRIPPIRCGGNRTVVKRNIWIRSRRDAIVVKGNCTLKIYDSIIEARHFAVKALGNGDIHLVRTKVQGLKGAILISGNGDVYTKFTKIKGRVIVKGNGDLNKGPGTVIFSK